MAKVTVKQSSSQPAAAAFEKICKMLDQDPGLRKLDPSYKCEFNAQQLTGSAKGSKFSADMRVSPSDAGSEVTIVVELPLLLSPFKTVVESTLKNKLEKALS
jgi:hypothetical protein